MYYVLVGSFKVTIIGAGSIEEDGMAGGGSRNSGDFFICVLIHHTECHNFAYVFRELHSFPIWGFWICVSMRIVKKISGRFFGGSGPCVQFFVPYWFISRIARVIIL